MKQNYQMIWLVVFVALVCGLAVPAGTPLFAQEAPADSFVLYMPIAVANTGGAGGQSDVTCPYLPDSMRYRYTPANDQTGSFHRHSFLVDYTINDFSYMNMAAEYVVATDDALSDTVLTGITPSDVLPMGILTFGEYSQSPLLQNGFTYHWRIRLHCTDVEGENHLGAWTEVQTMVAGE